MPFWQGYGPGQRIAHHQTQPSLGHGVPGYAYGAVSEPAEVPLGPEHWDMDKRNPGWYHDPSHLERHWGHDPMQPVSDPPPHGFPDQNQGAPAPAEATEHSELIDEVNHHIAKLHLARAIHGILEDPRTGYPKENLLYRDHRDPRYRQESTGPYRDPIG